MNKSRKLGLLFLTISLMFFAILFLSRILKNDSFYLKNEKSRTILSCQSTDYKIVIVGDDNPEGIILLSLEEVASTYGMHGNIVIIGDDNPEGIILLSLEEVASTYGMHGNIVIVGDDNPEGTILCSLGDLSILPGILPHNSKL